MYVYLYMQEVHFIDHIMCVQELLIVVDQSLQKLFCLIKIIIILNQLDNGYKTIKFF